MQFLSFLNIIIPSSRNKPLTSLLSAWWFRLLNFCFRAWVKEDEVIFKRLQRVSFISSLEGASFERRTCAFSLENRLLKRTKVRNQIFIWLLLLRFSPFQKGKGIPAFAWKHSKSCFQGEVLGYALAFKMLFVWGLQPDRLPRECLSAEKSYWVCYLNFRWGFMYDAKKDSWSALLKGKVSSWVPQMMIKSFLSSLFLLTIVKVRW